jgi:outer membrane protein TolC
MLLFLIAVSPIVAQQITLEDCYDLAKKNYPLVKQQELIIKSKEYTVQNANRAYLPQLNINGQATYQSAVTALPIQLPGITIPQLSKDQYRIYGEVNQFLFDGGMTSAQKKIAESSANLETQKMETELYKLKERINQIYFGILLLDAQHKQLSLLMSDLDANLRRVDAAFQNGAALKSNAQVIQAELLKSKQRETEILASRKMYLEMLSLFTGTKYNENTTLQRPVLVTSSGSVHRPELMVLDLQASHLQLQTGMIRSKSLPKVSLFLQAGYGRPALNMLSNTFESYYIGGLRLNWSLTGLYTLKNEKSLIEINKRNLEIQKEIFVFNTGFNLSQQNSETTRLNELLKTDDEIIALRSSISKSYSAQLENGVLNSADYLRERNAEEQARENKVLHETQLLMAAYNLKTSYGD